MKRLVATALIAGALLVPTTVVAQDASPEASMGLIGVGTFDVCLAISGPVIQITPEALTEGIASGSFVIEGFSSDCDNGLMAPDESPMADASMDDAGETDG